MCTTRSLLEASTLIFFMERVTSRMLARFWEFSILVFLLDMVLNMLCLFFLTCTKRFRNSRDSLTLPRRFAIFLLQWGTAHWQSRNTPTCTTKASILDSSSHPNAAWPESISPFMTLVAQERIEGNNYLKGVHWPVCVALHHSCIDESWLLAVPFCHVPCIICTNASASSCLLCPADWSNASEVYWRCWRAWGGPADRINSGHPSPPINEIDPTFNISFNEALHSAQLCQQLDLSHLDKALQTRIYGLIRKYWSVFDDRGVWVPVKNYEFVIDTGADPWNTPLWRAFLVANRPNYDVWVACLFATINAATLMPSTINIIEWIIIASVWWWVPLWIVKAVDTNESYGNTIVFTVL